MPIELLQQVTNRISRPWWTWRLRSHVEAKDFPHAKLGTSYGGYVLPESAIRAGGIAICAGAGEDISFDVELNKRGFKVFTLDPTPRSKEHAADLVRAARENTRMPINRSSKDFYDLRGFDPDRFHFEDVGLWNEDTTLRFFAPKNPEHVSHSFVNLQRTDRWIEAPCLTLESFCRSRGIPHVDILKLDVEGSEYAVIGNLLKSPVRPTILCIDFDELRIPIDDKRRKRILGTLNELRRHGYRFRHMEKANALLVRDDAALPLSSRPNAFAGAVSSN